MQSIIQCPLGDDETENIRKTTDPLGGNEAACEDWALGLISKQDYLRLGARSAYVCERLVDRAWQLTGEWHEAIGEFHANWHAMVGGTEASRTRASGYAGCGKGRGVWREGV